ncbi:hypothetical protein J437_LFUL013660 [Ladona fulva]|uniref:RRM domain-containing protein n=1 Tax=Ladona fulva TaxID=123851 RepID=A0A8K0KD91_LADFU|nr:hypothetical protein J437_LFUL013660 [Ladona fulva]
MAEENDATAVDQDESGDDNIVVTLGPVIQPSFEELNLPSKCHDKLVKFGLDEKVISSLEDIFKTEKLAPSDLDERALDALKEIPVDVALDVLTQFAESSLEHVSNKSAYLCGVMKTLRQKHKAGQKSQTSNITVKGPDQEKIKLILEKTGYSFEVTTGQRKYGGPPPEWMGPPPEHGCEVFCGRIPKDLYEDELIPLFEKYGRLWDLRLMMDPVTGANRGFAFITYIAMEAAKKAVQELDEYEIKPGKPLKVNLSVPNLRLFIGNIPKSKDKEDLMAEFGKLTDGLTDVIIYSSPDDEKKNRGFCFLEYNSHKSASLAKRRLSSMKSKIWGLDIFVDWADPQQEPDEETMSKVKVLYVRNLTIHCTEKNLKEAFEVYGIVERVKKMKDYAFIHFEEREDALKAMKELNGIELGGSNIEITLAKPPFDKKKKEGMLRAREKRTMRMLFNKGCAERYTAHAVHTSRLMHPNAALAAHVLAGDGYSRGENYFDFEKYGYGGGYTDPFYEDYFGYDDMMYDFQHPPSIPLIRPPVHVKPSSEYIRPRVAW